MQLPDGRECPHYYADFHRRDPGVEYCRLLENTPDAEEWNLEFCTHCPAPDYLRVNACQQMKLQARIGRRHFWKKRQVLIQATCSQGPITNPAIGCGHCHPRLTFVVGEPPKQS